MIRSEFMDVTRVYHQAVPVSGKCDECGKELTQNGSGLYDYYRLSTSHNNWGNDSCDSYKYYDFCCIDCMLKFVDEFWSGLRGPRYSIGHDTYEMEICHKFQLEEH